MASIASHLKNPKTLKLLNPTKNLTFIHQYSSSSSNNNNNGDESQKPTDFSSYFNDIKSRLKNQTPQNQKRPSFNFSPTEQIHNNLSEFRKRSAPDSVVDIYKRTTNTNPNPNPNVRKGGISIEGIRESLRGLNAQKDKNAVGRLPLNTYMDNFRPNVSNQVIGGTVDSLPISVFGKELKEKKRKKVEGEDEMLTRHYSVDELGMRLRELRPELAKGGDGDWFSFSELNERLKKLRVIEEEESLKANTLPLRSSFLNIKRANDQEDQKKASGRLFLLGGIHSTKKSLPKEHLIEKYFHPDNMSSEEKLKLKLKEVRDEFKMHESDCGSPRVQIAQLTTEILHLSSVLHKKDKHSRKGLIAKVQQRKKLLKYLRKTDWDSYCLVLSKLGLRDNPDYKN